MSCRLHASVCAGAGCGSAPTTEPKRVSPFTASRPIGYSTRIGSSGEFEQPSISWPAATFCVRALHFDSSVARSLLNFGTESPL